MTPIQLEKELRKQALVADYMERMEKVAEDPHCWQSKMSNLPYYREKGRLGPGILGPGLQMADTQPPNNNKIASEYPQQPRYQVPQYVLSPNAQWRHKIAEETRERAMKKAIDTMNKNRWRESSNSVAVRRG